VEEQCNISISIPFSSYSAR